MCDKNPCNHRWIFWGQKTSQLQSGSWYVNVFRCSKCKTKQHRSARNDAVISTSETAT